MHLKRQQMSEMKIIKNSFFGLCFIITILLTVIFYKDKHYYSTINWTLRIIRNSSNSKQFNESIEFSLKLTRDYDKIGISKDPYDILMYNISNNDLDKLNDSRILVVTSYINLGNFVKKDNPFRVKGHYLIWATKFSKIKNHVICFTDDWEFYRKFRVIRHGLPTTLAMVNKSELPSYRKLPDIQRIFSQPGYPSHEPDTKHPEYTAVMIGKYDFVAMAMKLFPKSGHVMWLDIGLFRAYSNEAACFYLIPPPGFNTSKIAFNLVNDDFQKDLTSFHIVEQLRVWLCGCIFYGTREAMWIFIDQYRAAVDRLISLNILGSDQQTLFSLFSDPIMEDLREVEVQAYKTPLNVSVYDSERWFHLGYRMRFEDKCETESRSQTSSNLQMT